ncbi:hypothetical protein PoB_003599100 [Plakobranchus ocellatus]|uniref:Uncharacterized protein n=1 Tax=Plakobranchus ocellatus TaxID=259542 RepID=A0AAV4AMS7_9GAST|nr:hypothetical protein PoB_003599100 [Plakobranchus ocellatus]
MKNWLGRGWDSNLRLLIGNQLPYQLSHRSAIWMILLFTGLCQSYVCVCVTSKGAYSSKRAQTQPPSTFGSFPLVNKRMIEMTTVLVMEINVE